MGCFLQLPWACAVIKPTVRSVGRELADYLIGATFKESDGQLAFACTFTRTTRHTYIAYVKSAV